MPNLEDSRYPSTDQMPEMAAGAPGTPEADATATMDNPVIKALQTIQTWISAMKEKGMPGIEGVEENFIAMLQSASQGGGPEMPEQPEEAPEMPAQPQSKPVPMGGGSNQMPMNANKTAKTLI